MFRSSQPRHYMESKLGGLARKLDVFEDSRDIDESSKTKESHGENREITCHYF